MEWDISLLCYGLVIGLGAGALAGLMAGLAGVGGGLVYVPVFYLCMPHTDAGIALAVFASMVAITMTSVFSARTHWQLGHVHTGACYRLCPGLLIGASTGLWSTLILPEIWLLLALAALNAWVAYDYGRVLSVRSSNKCLLVFLGVPIGYISGALGIAGGTMLVPLLRRFLTLKAAVGTSAVCGAAMVILAVLLNVFIEPDWQVLLSTQWGFLIAAWIGTATAMPRALMWSSHWHDICSESFLRRLLKGIFTLFSLVFLVLTAWKGT